VANGGLQQKMNLGFPKLNLNPNPNDSEKWKSVGFQIGKKCLNLTNSDSNCVTSLKFDS